MKLQPDSFCLAQTVTYARVQSHSFFTLSFTLSIIQTNINARIKVVDRPFDFNLEIIKCLLTIVNMLVRCVLRCHKTRQPVIKIDFGVCVFVRASGRVNKLDSSLSLVAVNR